MIRSLTEEDPFPKSVNIFMFRDDHEKHNAIRMTIPKFSASANKTVAGDKD